jgi:acyl-CoA thioesterase
MACHAHVMGFTQDTTVTYIDGTGHITISDGWSIGDKPNGGYLVAIMLNAMQQRAQQPDPISVTTHFSRPTSEGLAATIEVEVIRTGRTTSLVTAVLYQDGKERIRSTAVFGDLTTAGPDHEIVIEPPTIAPFNDCVPRMGNLQGVEISMLDQLEVRIDPSQSVAGGGTEAAVTAWVQLRDGSEPDVITAAMFSDALPPAIFTTLGQVGWVPTIELTVQVRRRPAPGPMLAELACRDLSNGLMIEDAKVWDTTGALCVQARQLAMLLTVETP